MSSSIEYNIHINPSFFDEVRCMVAGIPIVDKKPGPSSYTQHEKLSSFQLFFISGLHFPRLP